MAFSLPRLYTLLERCRMRWRWLRDLNSLAHLDDRMLDDIGAPAWACDRLQACRQQRRRREAAVLDGGGVLPW